MDIWFKKKKKAEKDQQQLWFLNWQCNSFSRILNLSQKYILWLQSHFKSIVLVRRNNILKMV